jgi:hypothetical protein
MCEGCPVMVNHNEEGAPPDYTGCTCWWRAYVKHGGGTGWDIARYDPECPEHGGGETDVLPLPQA